MRAGFGILAALIWLATGCMGGTDTGNPSSNNERFNAPELDSPTDGCQEPFEFVCEDETVIFKDPVTCEWEECP